MLWRRLLPIGIASLVALLGIACGGGGSDGGGGGTNTWVGKVEGSDAYIAMLIEGTARYVYVTDGKEMSLLFRGNIGETDELSYFTLRDDQNRVINVQAPTGRVFKGLLTVSEGRHLPFTAAPATEEAGLYRAKAGSGESRWIVLEDGSFRGATDDGDGTLQSLTTLGGEKWSDPTTDP